jgi:hypothetical protein
MRFNGPALVSLAALLLALSLPALLPGQVPPGQVPPGQAPQQGTSLPAPQFNPTIPSGPAPDLDLLFTAQVAGWIEPCG